MAINDVVELLRFKIE